MPNEGDWCHIEIPSRDLERAKAFYAEVFGWTFHDVPGMDYSFFTTSENALSGGIMRNERAPRHPVGYVAVDAIASMIARIESKAGGVVLEKTAFGEAGWLAWVKDPDGNVFGLWERKKG